MIAISRSHVLTLFRSGLDSFDIARKLGITEAAVVRLLSDARLDERRAKRASA
jgi:predicted transcriptional regulator